MRKAAATTSTSSARSRFSSIGFSDGEGFMVKKVDQLNS